jgi:hypothetical protein
VASASGNPFPGGKPSACAGNGISDNAHKMGSALSIRIAKRFVFMAYSP